MIKYIDTVHIVEKTTSYNDKEATSKIHLDDSDNDSMNDLDVNDVSQEKHYIADK